MEFTSRYVSHVPDAQGYVDYSAQEHRVWSILFKRQMGLTQGRACNEFAEGLQCLGITAEHIPQLPDLNRMLHSKTGWQVAPVTALISAREFFELLSNQCFPVATFIRCEEELDYVKEPDIFHEIFGHCPLLTNPIFADFMHDYARKVLTFPETDWPLLQRMFWFTVEFGLIKTPQGLRAYGGGILSSIAETVYSVESEVPLRVLFDPVAVLRMPYRIDTLQPVYFVIEDFASLYAVVVSDMAKHIATARSLGELPALFNVEPNNPNIHIYAC